MSVFSWNDMNSFTRSACLLVAAALTACGGGGGGGTSSGSSGTPAPPSQPSPPSQPPSTPQQPAAPAPFTIKPATATARYVTGSSTLIVLEARRDDTAADAKWIMVAESGPIKPRLGFLPPNYVIQIYLETSADIRPGRYTGNITLNVCEDVDCAKPVPGSPIRHPYDILVLPVTSTTDAHDLKALSPISGASDWDTYQGNARHTAYVPVTLSPASFSLRWKWTAGGPDSLPTAPVTGDGRVYLSGGQHVLALNETDGSLAWRHPLPNLYYSSGNQPAYSNGKIYVTAGTERAAELHGLNAATGKPVFTSPMGAQFAHWFAPIVVNGKVYTEGGPFGGIYGFDAQTGAEAFFTDLPQFHRWSPAFDGSRLLAYTGFELHVIDPATGAVSHNIEDPHRESLGLGDVGSAAVVGNSGLVFAGHFDYPIQNAITAFDPAAKTIRWTVKGDFAGNPAYADATLFAINNAGGQLQALREADGTVSWTWRRPAADRSFVGNVIVTRNLVFVSTDRAVYAIDRTSHQAVWSHPVSGQLALSANGVLYVRDDSGITAFNLR